jgi:hypothetical protein
VCAAGTPAPIRIAAGLTPGTAEEEPKPFSEWIELGSLGVPPPVGAALDALPGRLPTRNTGAASRRPVSSGIW